MDLAIGQRPSSPAIEIDPLWGDTHTSKITDEINLGRLVPSPEGWYILCRGRRPRLQVQSKIRAARRADTQDLLRHSWSFTSVLCQPSGLCA